MQEYQVKVYENRTEWYQNGKLHRLDGPAVECTKGYKEWYQNGQRHRLDGPAVECRNGIKVWYQNGQRHRLDGPAFEWADGSKAWYVEGKCLTETEFNAKVNQVELTLDEIASKFNISVEQLKIKK